MAFLDHITLEDTPAGTAVRNYLEGQNARNKEMLVSSMSEDVILYGKIFKVSGRDAVVATFLEFLTNMVVSLRIEAVTRVEGSDQFIVLFNALIKGNEKEMPIVDLLCIKDGKINRVDDCFDVNKVPK